MLLGEIIHVMADVNYIIEPEDMENPKCINDIAFADIDQIPRIKLCFICEEETVIEGLATHPVFIPLYECIVYRIEPEKDTLRIWLDMKSVYEEICKPHCRIAD